MSRYRTVEVRMWTDEKFRQLSPIPPCGQGLWLYLLTNPETVNVPGLYRAGEAGLAEALGWSVKDFRKAFAEAQALGMVEADWKARVVWVPNAIKMNQPESPNVVRSWRNPWKEIPGCPLKHKAYSRLKAFVEGIGEGFAKAFGEACGKPSPNQEQEQEQEQEKDTLAPDGAASALAIEAFRDRYHALCPMLPRVTALSAHRRQKIAARLREHPLPWWEEVFTKAATLPFLAGDGPRGWRADLDWFIANAEHALRVTEGRYDDSHAGRAGDSGRERQATRTAPGAGDHPDKWTAEATRDAERAARRHASATATG